MQLFRRNILTSQGEIAVLESSGSGMPVLLVHGNSSCKEVFRLQLGSKAAARYRMIALDLPGHGSSGNASSAAAYSIPGYADVVTEVLHGLDIDTAAMLGWSLGGHIGLELLGRGTTLQGLMLVGAPPFARGLLGLARAFRPHPGLLLATRTRLDDEDIERFVSICLDDAANPFFREMAKRADPRARRQLLRSMLRGDGVDQRWAAEHARVLIAVVNGEREPFARFDYLRKLAYEDLWGGSCHVIPNAGHAPFLDQPEIFNDTFGRFLDDVVVQAGPDVRTRQLMA